MCAIVEPMRRLIAFFILSTVKIISHVFWSCKYEWIGPVPAEPWKKTRIIALMNHTSLYEPIYSQAFSFSYLWHLAGHLNVPGADVTLNRPVVGFFWKLMVPNIAPVSRKKDETWSNYLNSIEKDCIVMIAPEGRMKRPNGLDKSGKPMTDRGGLVDIIETIGEGGMMLCFSGGLHHVQKPGQHFPTPFKPIKMNLAYIDIPSYLASFPIDPRERKIAIVQDLQFRLENHCPSV